VSKVVRGVGRAVSKVVSGVKNVVKQVAKSKLGKVLIGAAALYFGVPMLAGAFGGAAAGAAAGSGVLGTIGGAVSGGLSGAAAGISQAWAGLTGAASALGAGSLSGAGSSLAGGFSPSAAFAAGGGAAAPAGAAAFTGQTMTGLQTVGTDVAGSAAKSVSASPWTQGPTGLNVLASEAGRAGAGSTGLIGKMMASPYAAPALISSGTQLIGGVMQGYGARQEQKRVEDMDAQKLGTYNRNIGTRLF
jgi:hypothetical protein